MKIRTKWIFAICIFGFFSISEAKQQCIQPDSIKSKCNENYGNANNLGTEESPLIVKSIPISKTTGEIAQEDEDRQSKKSESFLTQCSNWLLVIFNAVLTLSTVALWVETRRLRKLSNQQSEDMKKSLELAKLSTDSSVALELPLFVIEKSSMSVQGGMFDFLFVNHGRTPALITESCFVWQIDLHLPLTPEYPHHFIKNELSSKLVAPNGRYEINQRILISTENWNQMIDGTNKFWVYGFIGYIDFLKKKRRTGFCLALVPRVSTSYPSSTPNLGDFIQAGPASYSYDELVSN